MSSFPGSCGELSKPNATKEGTITVSIRPAGHGRRSKIITTQLFRTILFSIEKKYRAQCHTQDEVHRTAELRVDPQFLPGLETYLGDSGLEIEGSRHLLI